MGFPDVRLSRDTAILAVALGGLGYETVLAHPVQNVLVAAFLSMIGLPVALRVDENRKAKGDGGAS